MALSSQNYKNWEVEDVSRWLGIIHLSNLIPTFERVGITGATLSQMDESFIKEKLRMTKPAEIMALKGAISNLVESAQAPPPASRRKIPSKQNSVSQVMAGDRLRATSIEKPSSKTFPQAERRLPQQPVTLPRNYIVSSERRSSTTREPQLVDISAPEVLDEHVRYSGWIRKQGGGYKNWKRRYLILRLGCLYYYTNETSSHPKGSFTLSGYKAEFCRDPKITEKFKWTLKLSPVTSAMRTYYMSVGAKRELELWKQAIDEEIDACAKRSPSLGTSPLIPPGEVWERDYTTYVSSPGSGDRWTFDNVPDVIAEDYGSDDDDDDVMDHDENIYDDPEGDEDDPYSNVDDPEIIYDEPEHVECDDDDDPYAEIQDGLPPLPPMAPSTAPVHTSPSQLGVGTPLSVKNFKDINEWEVTPAHRMGSGKGGAPSVPMRSPVSLGLVGDKNSSGSPRADRKASAGQAQVNESDETYLSIIAAGTGTPTATTPDPQEKTRISSPPVEEKPPISDPQGPKTILRGGREIILPQVETPEDTDRDYEDDYPEDDDDGPYEGDSDAYYILFRKPDELMPPSCVFDKLDRVDADRLLRAKNRDGTYLIRAGTHAGAERVLSVWHNDRCRHYKLFKDDNGHYSLTQGQIFRTIPELIQYYALQSHLPRSDFYLGDPYYPEDH